MWKSFSFVVAAAVLAASSVAEAKRLGGGKSLGAQREAPAATRQGAAPATPAAPSAAPQPAAPAAAAGGTAAAGAAAKTGMARWAGPLAAIAAGLGLGYLFSQLGAGGFLVFLLVALAGIVLIALLARRMMKSAAPVAANGAPLQYQASAPSSGPAFTPASAGTGAAVSGIPVGFDKAGFEQQAKKQFLALQAANDRGDLDALRDLVTDEFYNQAAKDVIHGNKEATAFDMLNAELLSIETDRGLYWAQVEFSGTVREDGVVMGSPFREVWNLNKPVDGSRGWLLAGIQQV